MKTKEFALPILRMVAAKKLRTEGQKRGTRYSAGGKQGPKAGKAKRATAGRKAKRTGAKGRGIRAA